MTTALKHVGRLKDTKQKVLVVFKTIPDDFYNCLVASTSNFNDEDHNSIMTVVESTQGQDAFELGEVLANRYFRDGRPMLASLHQDGKLVKIPTSRIEMTPTTTDVINLDELNVMIAEQRGTPVPNKGVEVQELARVQDIPNTTDSAQPLSDKDLARSYRSQADAMYKEASRLRKQADELDPPAKKTVKAKEEVSA